MFKILRNKDPKICCAHGCKNKRATNDNLCCKHRKRRKKENDPIGYTFDTLRSNAKRRGKVFTITLEYFRQFCEDTNYIELKGKSSHSASIDRKKAHLGYEPGNLQVLSLSDNTKKQFEDNKCPF